MKKIKLILFLTIFGLQITNAQDITNNIFGKGILVYAKDSSFYMKISTRFQTLYDGSLNLDTEDWSDQLLIRRARLKFEGFAYSPKLKYKIELGLSNRDTRSGQIPQSGNTANIILDAVLKWNFAQNWELWFGQTKLPGNRERVISSQKLQFVDRSLVNSRFNIDRDLGLQLHHKDKIGNMIIRETVAISMGEGRDIIVDNRGGYDYTARIELFPFGEFQGKGAYFGSDLEREETPKLAVGSTFDFNDGARRQRGQLGSFITDLQGNEFINDLRTIFVDAMFKYQGLSLMAEYANKSAANEIPGTGWGTGEGFVIQSGYLFPNNFEVAARFTTIEPDDLVFSTINEETEYTLGLSRYIVGHNLKVQSDISLVDRELSDNDLRFRFQVELSF